LDGSSTPLRPRVYCVLPRDLAPALHELLRRHFSHDDQIEVVVERRDNGRRMCAERRTEPADPLTPTDRRRIRHASGRRVAERRALTVTIEPPVLPRRARNLAGRLLFVERLEPSSQTLEDVDTSRLVIQFQTGDRDVFATLYMRHFGRVYGYLRILLRDPHEAEDAAQEVFLKAFQALARYELREVPFRGWLFTIARNHVLDRLGALERIAPVEPEELHRRREASGSEADFSLEWITDRELLMFIERLPLAQQQVLLLRYMYDLPYDRIAQVLGRTSPNEVRKLHQRATAQLRARLEAIGREPRAGRRAQWQRRPTFLGVIRARRYALRY
jgi:RNA polymerase sigma-70 factor (ECF subfamily)